MGFLSNFAWLPFVFGIIFALFVWPMVMSFVSGARSKVSKPSA